jgi:hypothetical protein
MTLFALPCSQTNTTVRGLADWAHTSAANTIIEFAADLIVSYCGTDF